jgi:hypothetical protein
MDYTQLVIDRVRAGGSGHLVTILFSQLPGARSALISRMRGPLGLDDLEIILRGDRLVQGHCQASVGIDVGRRARPDAGRLRIAVEKTRLQAQIAKLPPDSERDALHRKIRQQLETALHFNEWASSPELQPLKPAQSVSQII